MINVDSKTIENFLNGNNPKQYVVGIEANYTDKFVNLIINDPQTGKRIEKHPYKPFIWFKEDVSKLLYNGSKLKAITEAQKYGVKSKRLKISDVNGNVPKRLENGYKFIATSEKSYNDLVQYFKAGGVDIFNKSFSKLFFAFTPVEQFMIQTGIRMFKGMEDYNDLHRFQFDLETEGLLPSKDGIFQIGMRDNRGFEFVLETIGDTPKERRESERDNIKEFFKRISMIQPDTITGYNSESFDWNFIVQRCQRLDLDITQIAKGLDGTTSLKRKPSILKLGNEMEPYDQTYMYGYNIIDIAHSVRRAQAINSDIKSWGLKYITKYSELNKDNRVYVSGDKIHSTWSDTVNQYAFNNKNGDWYKISEKMPLKDDYEIKTGAFIVQRYLLDDLWETEQVDTIFNQAAFLIAKLLPTTYSRSSTMGTASQWKLIMAAWSYENNLAIPETEPKRDFTGGLSRLLKVGFAKNVVKFDYAALYPKNQLTNKIFPDLDISGVMEGLLTYVVDTRDTFKFLTGKHKKIAKSIQEELDNNDYSPEKIEDLKVQIKENKALANLYDKKQLPLKILANSWFGAYGAPYIFNWGASDCAEETTCRGRQYLRLMVKHFHEKYNFQPLVGDTDGFNFAFPDDINNVKYIAKGNHWKTTEYAGKELSGLDAVLAEFNEGFMIGRMGLDIDDIYESTINFARKNYANLLDGKIKLVGNSIKSKKMPVYIEEFLQKAIKMLLNGKGYEFINYYYDYVDLIYNYSIPVVKIASKSKVKSNVSDYKKKAKTKNKAGNPMPRQAHMELAIINNLDVNLGDTIYYVNTGSSKGTGDIKTLIRSKMTKKEILDYVVNNGCTPNFETELQINCELIDSNIVESNLELLKEIESLQKILLTETDEEKINVLNNTIAKIESELDTTTYNVAKYLEAFNKKVKPLLVCFNSVIREDVLLSIIKDKKTKLEKLKDRKFFTESECELVFGIPNKEGDQDTYEELMTMEDKEIKFWVSVNKTPNDIDIDKWEEVKVNYFEKKEIERIDGIKHEKVLLDNIFKKFEYDELVRIKNGDEIPHEIYSIGDFDFDNNSIVSIKWGGKLADITDILKYENEIFERNSWYELTQNKADDRYERWIDYKNNLEFYSGKTLDFIVQGADGIEEVVKEADINTKKLLPKRKQKKLVVNTEDEDEDGDDVQHQTIDDFSNNIQKFEFLVEVDNIKPAFDIIDAEEENEELIIETKPVEEEEDEWNF